MAPSECSLLRSAGVLPRRARQREMERCMGRLKGCRARRSRRVGTMSELMRCREVEGEVIREVRQVREYCASWEKRGLSRRACRRDESSELLGVEDISILLFKGGSGH
jgi:hypothetical protein